MALSILPALLAFTALASTGTFQNAPDNRNMRKLDFLVGKWEGEGWQLLGPDEKVEFKGTEIVQSKLSGGALLVEGEFFAKDGGKVVHQTLGIINWKPEKAAFNMRAYMFNRPEADYKLDVTDNGFKWSIQLDHGATIAYTMRLTPEGDWLETGTYGMDGMDPVPIFEMRLKKVKA